MQRAIHIVFCELLPATMGSNCCSGDREDDYKLTQSESSPSNVEKPKKKNSKQMITWTENGFIGLYGGSFFAKPLLDNDDILFISSYEDHIVIVCYDSETNENINYDEIEIKCENNDDHIEFDVRYCEYTIDAINKLVYIISDTDDENEKNIIKLDLKDNTATLLHTIKVKNDNHPQIMSFKNRIYILGASSDDEKKSNEDNFVYVPYSKSMNGFGSRSVCINVNKSTNNYLYLIGGEKQDRDIVAPHQEIQILNINEYKWECKYLPQPMTSFGCINYKNIYLIIFGGYRYKKKEKQFQKSNTINVLDLESGNWFKLSLKLPEKNGFYAIYYDESDIVHLIAFEGRHYSLMILDIIEAIEMKQTTKICNWNEKQNNVRPSKSARMDESQQDEDVDLSKNAIPTKAKVKYIKRRAPKNVTRKRRKRRSAGTAGEASKTTVTTHRPRPERPGSV